MAAGLVVLASIITGLAWLMGATDAFVDGLHWSLYLTAAVAVAAAHALEHVGLPEARLNLSQAAIYLARAPKSNASYVAIKEATRDVQERGTLQADVDERRLHAGQHSRHAPGVETADQAAARGALDQQLLNHPRGNDGDARFLGTDVNEDFFHASFPGARRFRTAAAP